MAQWDWVTYVTPMLGVTLGLVFIVSIVLAKRLPPETKVARKRWWHANK